MLQKRPADRLREKTLVQRTGQLMYELSRLYPAISGAAPAYGWDVPLTHPIDGLMYAGSHRNFPFHHFAFGTLHGPARALLTAEPTALNFLQLLSGVPTATRRYVDLTAGTRAAVLDTRKTLPGLRLAEKYAVRVGGGKNQRLALYDGILIKENHIMAAGGIAAALRAARDVSGGVPIQIEVESLGELRQALDAGAVSVLLDNFSLDDLAAAVALNAGRALLEASGGIRHDTVRAIAQTGVDRISIGSLTKDIQAVDYSLRIV